MREQQLQLHLTYSLSCVFQWYYYNEQRFKQRTILMVWQNLQHFHVLNSPLWKMIMTSSKHQATFGLIILQDVEFCIKQPWDRTAPETLFTNYCKTTITCKHGTYTGLANTTCHLSNGLRNLHNQTRECTHWQNKNKSYFVDCACSRALVFALGALHHIKSNYKRRWHYYHIPTSPAGCVVVVCMYRGQAAAILGTVAMGDRGDTRKVDPWWNIVLNKFGIYSSVVEILVYMM